MASYLLVRNEDGAILDELDSAESALRMLEWLSADPPLPGLSLVRVEESPGAIIGTQSITAMRAAGFAPPQRRRGT